MRAGRQERGSGTALAALVVLLAAVMLMVLLGVGVGVAALHRARNAADLAALAGAVALADGTPACDAAAVVATRNGAGLAGCVVEEGTVTVVASVELGGRARYLPQRVEAQGTASVE